MRNKITLRQSYLKYNYLFGKNYDYITIQRYTIEILIKLLITTQSNIQYI